MNFGTFLVQENKVTQTELNDALEIQKKFKKKKIGRLLVDLGFLTQETLNRSLTEFFKPEIKNIHEVYQKMKNGNHLSEGLKTLALSHKAIVLDESESKIEFIRLEVMDDRLLELTQSLTGKEVLCFVVDKEEFNFLCNSTGQVLIDRPQLVVSKNLTDDEKLDEDAPYSKLFSEVMLEAKKNSASDIHIEPTSEGVTIRFRLFGTLVTYKTLKKEHREGFISKVKNIVNMDLAIVGKPQDARASFKLLKTDIRANSLPNLWGEKIVLRLLDQERDFRLEQSGLSLDSVQALRTVSKRKDGLILISGPTGSGKTTTLYSVLYELPRDKLNVSTLENPVEYQLAGVNQVNIREDGVSTFEGSLRALMRQDPDVILVGEIRDHQTASLAFKAASTGHLVLSTVHANGSKEVVERLINLGIDTFTIKSNLRLSAAQRLIPLICPHCSTKADQKESKLLGTEGEFKKINFDGCSQCRSGVTGRIAVLEYMEENEIKRFIDSPKNSINLPKQSLKKEIIELAKLGKVDFSEALAVI
jgi:type II secretory ATPase GspE/PulE/Tfp pilus assembly ATPase PilB-like protein